MASQTSTPTSTSGSAGWIAPSAIESSGTTFATYSITGTGSGGSGSGGGGGNGGGGGGQRSK